MHLLEGRGRELVEAVVDDVEVAQGEVDQGGRSHMGELDQRIRWRAHAIFVVLWVVSTAYVGSGGSVVRVGSAAFRFFNYKNNKYV